MVINRLKDNTLIISDNENTLNNTNVLYWNNPSKNTISKKFFNDLSKNKKYLRKEYLNFTDILIKNIKLKQKFSFLKYYVDFSLISQKSIYKSEKIFECIKLINLKYFLTGYQYKRVKLKINNQSLYLSLKNFFPKNLLISKNNFYFISKDYKQNCKSLILAFKFLIVTFLRNIKLPSKIDKLKNKNDKIILFSYFSNIIKDKKFYNLYYGNFIEKLKKKIL